MREQVFIYYYFLLSYMYVCVCVCDYVHRYVFRIVTQQVPGSTTERSISSRFFFYAIFIFFFFFQIRFKIYFFFPYRNPPPWCAFFILTVITVITIYTITKSAHRSRTHCILIRVRIGHSGHDRRRPRARLPGQDAKLSDEII